MSAGRGVVANKLEASGQLFDQWQVVGPVPAAGTQRERRGAAHREVLTAAVRRGVAASRVDEVQGHAGTAGELYVGGAEVFVPVRGEALLHAGGHLGGFDIRSLALLAYMAGLSAAAFALWSLLMKHNPVGMLAVFNFLIPVFGVLLSAVFLHEPVLAWKNAAALALVCAGIFLVTRKGAVRAA